MTALPLLAESVTWIKVQKPTFDLVGVVLYSFGIAGICAAVALVLGIALGIVFVRRTRERTAFDRHVALHLN